MLFGIFLIPLFSVYMDALKSFLQTLETPFFCAGNMKDFQGH